MKRSAQTVLQEGMFYTIAAANGRVLEVADFNTENGASVRLWSYEGQPWQQMANMGFWAGVVFRTWVWALWEAQLSRNHTSNCNS